MPQANPASAQTGVPVHDDQLLLFQHGCASCHRSNGLGGAVGKDLSDASPHKIQTKVRDGPRGMPAFTSDMLSDADVQKIIAFLPSHPQ
jgi:mono/diheme cytochrome c family protein